MAPMQDDQAPGQEPTMSPTKRVKLSHPSETSVTQDATSGDPLLTGETNARDRQPEDPVTDATTSTSLPISSSAAQVSTVGSSELPPPANSVTAEGQDPGEDESKILSPAQQLALLEHLASPTTTPNPLAEPHNVDRSSDMGDADSSSTAAKSKMQAPDELEAKVGISCFVGPDLAGFTGVLKIRYTDFIVNEVDGDGVVVRLTTDRAPEKQVQQPTGNDEGVPDQTQDTTTNEAASSENAAVDQAPVAQATQHESWTKNPADEQLLTELLDATLCADLYGLFDKIRANKMASSSALKSYGMLESQPILDRTKRGKIHTEIRRIFNSRIDSNTNAATNCLSFYAVPKRKQQETGNAAQNQSSGRHQQRPGANVRGKLGWDELGGQHLHFTLYKENKDTMEVIAFLARTLRVGSRDFHFSGTKDRRAVTAQRVSVYRQQVRNLVRLNPMLRGSRLGDFKYEKHALELGDNGGNHFTVTLKNCRFPNDIYFDRDNKLKLAELILKQAAGSMKQSGFLNYFGLQRFGTFGIRTDEIGKLILCGDFQGAVDAILSVSDQTRAMAENDLVTVTEKVARDDVARARGIRMFRDGANMRAVLDVMPSKFSGETAIMRHLGQDRTQSDFVGALINIPRGLRTMYVHAYQSRIWNCVASHRWTVAGGKAVKGDLILVESAKTSAAATQDEVDENGEVVIHAAEADAAVTREDIYQQARPLTEEEANSGKYTVFDVVLPLPGFDVTYPDNDIGEYYKTLMAHDKLDPADMRRSQKDFSLSGGYRKFMAQVDFSFRVQYYSNDQEQLVDTDYDRIKKLRGETHQQGRDQRGHGGRWDANNPGRGGFGRGGRGRGGNRGGRYCNDFYSFDRDWRKSENVATDQGTNASDQAPESVAKLSDTTNRNHWKDAAVGAWHTFAAEIAEKDKVAKEARKIEESEQGNATEGAQPKVVENFVQVMVDDKGVRKAVRSVDEGAKISPVTPSLPRAVDSMNLDGACDDYDAAGGAPIENKGDAGAVASESSRNDPSRPTPIGQPDETFGNDSKVPNEGNVDPAAWIEAARVKASQKSEATEPSEAVETPADTLPEVEAAKPNKIAVILEFTLGSSQYATIALRELCKAGGLQTYKPDFSGGR